MLAAERKLEVLFRAAEGGHVFRAPNPWIVGDARHYFATEAQKDRILNILYMPQWVIACFWLAVFAVIFGGGTVLLYFLSGHEDPTTADVVIMAALAIAGLLLPLPLLGYWQLHRLRPILPELRPTAERISFSEITDAVRKATPASAYVRNCILCGIAFGAMMLNVGLRPSLAITKGSYLDPVLWGVPAILFAFAMVNNGLLAMRKTRELETTAAVDPRGSARREFGLP
jgi:hypothetical protein